MSYRRSSTKFSTILLIVVMLIALTFGVAYAIDKTRMDAGKPVVFSTWGKDYTPGDKAKDESDDNTKKDDVTGVETSGSDSVNTPAETEKEVTLYFADMDLVYLCGEKRVIKTDGGIAKAIVEAVIAGPVTDSYFGPVTSDVKVNSVSVDNETKTCTVDLSKEFILNNTGGASTETFAIYSIVNSLCQLSNIDRVKINIDGNKDAVFGGHYDISVPIEADMTIVK